MSAPPPGHGHITGFSQPPPAMYMPPPSHQPFAAPPPPVQPAQPVSAPYPQYVYYHDPATGYAHPPAVTYGYLPTATAPAQPMYSSPAIAMPPPTALPQYPTSVYPPISAPAGYVYSTQVPTIAGYQTAPIYTTTYTVTTPSASTSTAIIQQLYDQQDSNRLRSNTYSKELDLLLPPRKKQRSLERHRSRSPSPRRGSSHRSPSRHSSRESRSSLERRSPSRRSPLRRSSEDRRLIEDKHRQNYDREERLAREKDEREKIRREERGRSSSMMKPDHLPRHSQAPHHQSLPHNQKSPVKKLPRHESRPSPQRTHSQPASSTTTSKAIPTVTQPNPTVQEATANYNQSFPKTEPLATKINTEVTTQSVVLDPCPTTAETVISKPKNSERAEETAQPPNVIETLPDPLTEDRVPSPHSASSTNSGPLSPARGPSRRPQSPPSTCASPDEVSSTCKKSSAVIANNEAELKRLNMSLNEVINEEMKVWTRSAPADLYYDRDMSNPRVMNATPRLRKLLDRFEEELVGKAEKSKASIQGDYKPHKPATSHHNKTCCGKNLNSSSDDSSSEEDTEDSNANANTFKNESLEWMEYRAQQSFRLCKELWDNRPNELNDGPVCRCSQKSRKVGIRHGVFPGEEDVSIPLDPDTNNSDKLYHYRISISPPTNFLVKNPTVIQHDQHEFIFEGFSLFTVQPLKELPVCHVLRFSIKYSILYFEEKYPDNVTLRELKLFKRYFFDNLLDLVDWDVKDRFFFMPRFVRDLSENGKEILSMNEVISYLVKSYQPVVDEMDLVQMLNLPRMDWQNNVTEQVKGMLVTNPGMSPSALRVDQLDREQESPDVLKFPDIVHFGTRPQQLCYAGSLEYQKTWKEYVKYRHLLANMSKPSLKDKEKLEEMEAQLNKMRSNNNTKRDIAIAVSCQGFYKTGLMTDIVQHGLLLPVLVHHLRMHAALDHFQARIGYTFNNRSLLQLAMTHPSYKENFGTNPDHVRNTLTNCGIRQPEYGDKRVHSASTRKRGINMLISIMSRFGKDSETESKVAHNERLEFLGDAVVEFVTSVHLYHMFPDLEEGGLATYRAALVQNQHLAVLAEALGLENYMLYAHGSDLCHDAEMRHAMANCFEALMGAIYLDSGINEADIIFSKALFGTDPELHEVWVQMPPHPLQSQEPNGDRHWISTYPVLKKLVEFEEQIGVEFTHVRLLARAFSDRSLGNSNLTMGSNQRLEFLGDTVLQLVTSDFLYRHFPEHHEGHLSLLRSSMVNNRTQSVVCDDLDIPKYAMFAVPKKDMRMKDKADLLEAFIGALYVDKDLEYCRVFSEVCFFPRLQHFIINQEWNDPKSKLQQCCLTLRPMNGQDPDIPMYKVIESKGPTNTRVYTVAVYFRGKRLAKAEGHSIQLAEMAAAKLALDTCGYLFPHLTYQKRIVEKSLKRQSEDAKRQIWENQVRAERRKLGLDEINKECQRRNAERIAKLKSAKRISKKSLHGKISTGHRLSIDSERRLSSERHQSVERRLSVERHLSVDKHHSVDRSPEQRKVKRHKADKEPGSSRSRHRAERFEVPADPRDIYDRSLFESTSRHLSDDIPKSKHRHESKRLSSKYFDPKSSKYLDPASEKAFRAISYERKHRHKSSKSHSSKNLIENPSGRHSKKDRQSIVACSSNLTEIRTKPSKISNESQRDLNESKLQSNSSNLIAIKMEPGLDFSNAKATVEGAAVAVVKKEKRDEPLEDGECTSSDAE